MRPQSPAAMASFGVSHEPPTQATFFSARNCDAVSCEMPPVGQNVTSGSGPLIALSMPMPPAGTAGNSFSWRNPCSRAAITSDGVITPGSSGLPLLPGVMTPSEVMAAREQGFRQLKLFPAVPAGDIGMLNAINGPLPDVMFCPTGGISQETASQFLALKNVACVGGSWLTPKDAIAAGDWGRITDIAKAASGLR